MSNIFVLNMQEFCNTNRFLIVAQASLEFAGQFFIDNM